jgi:hypothetical protein
VRWAGTSGPRWIVKHCYEYRAYCKMCHIQVPAVAQYTVPVVYSTGTPGGFVAPGSSLVLPRAAADTRGQHSTLLYAMQELE